MNWDAVLDPLFLTPFVTGLLFAAMLPVLGPEPLRSKTPDLIAPDP